jgi:hypothetical protein
MPSSGRAARKSSRTPQAAARGSAGGVAARPAIASDRCADETVKRKSRQELEGLGSLDEHKMQTNLAKEAILDRIKNLEEAIAKGQAYRESGAHPGWCGFRAYFATKIRDGKVLPPHKDWVKNVFLPNRERALGKAEKLLERLNLEEQKKRS